MKNVFILGSGFSKDLCNFPLLNNLSEIILEAVQDKVLKEIISKVPNKIRSNVEWLMSYLHQEHAWHSAKQNYLLKAAFFEITTILSNYFEKLEKEKVSETYRDGFDKLLYFWHKHESSVITFNYDTLIERFAEQRLKVKQANLRTVDFNQRIGNVQVYGIINDELAKPREQEQDIDYFLDEPKRKLFFYFKNRSSRTSNLPDNTDPEITNAFRQISQRTHQKNLEENIRAPQLYQVPVKNLLSRDGSAVFGFPPTDTFKLIKLHGSINWYYSGQNSLGSEIYYELLQSDEKNNFSYSKRGLTPFIVPPILDKSGFYINQQLVSQWNLAKNLISDAEEIYIIGYSLPPTDLATSFMLQEALNSEATSRVNVLLFEDDSLEATRQRYQDLLDDPSRLNEILFKKNESSIDKLAENLKL